MKKDLKAGNDLAKEKEKSLYYKALNDIANQIHAAKDIDEILITLKDNILSLFDVDRITIYVVDGKKKEIFSRFKAGDIPQEIRVPINNKSIAGYTANTAQIISVVDAYDPHELAMINKDISFDRTWDTKHEYKTTQILSVPIFFKKYVIGVLQLINKKNGNHFTLEDQSCAAEMAKILGIAFYNQNKLAKQKAKQTKFNYLVKNLVITEKELERAVASSRVKGKTIESVLINDLKVKKEEVGQALADYYRCEYIPFSNNFPIPQELLSNLKPVYLRSNLWVPLARENGTVRVVVDNPERLDKIDSIKSLIPAENYELAVGLKEDIIQFLDYFYGTHSEKEEGSIDELLGKLETPETEELEAGADFLTENDNTIVQLVNKIIKDAYARNCSDIHIEPYPGKAGAEIRFRVDGNCQLYQTIPYNYKQAILSRIKIMAELDITERRKPQDGKISLKKFSPLDIELRVATVPTSSGQEDVVLRILAAGETIPLDQLGMSERDYDVFINMIQKPYGIILVVGPTGSGKTTTLHAALGYINKPETKIWTAEDPVEITQRGLRQVQVSPKIGFGFAAAMRAFLRADPDVIMVGEIRDQETASISIEASLTGHLVLTTLHTNSAPETIVRLLDMGMDSFNFSDALIGILGQRLVRTLCKDCKEPYHPSHGEYDALSRSYDADLSSAGFPYRDDLVLYRPSGCDKCNHTGYRGRTGLIELLEATAEVKQLIQTKATVEALRDQGIRDGMTTLMQDGIRKVLLGLTDMQQVRKVCLR
jgi:type II secretory ATPase GspE/PulE/Tfp pilus assembly ATPase PilB-like protein